MKYLRIIFSAILLAGSIECVAAEESNADQKLSAVTKQMNSTLTFSANYNQTKHFNILSSEINITGSIYIRREPFSLAWVMDTPMRYKVIMTNDLLTQWDEESGNVKEYKFSDNPVLSVISQVYRDILFGDFRLISGESLIEVNTADFTIVVQPKAGSKMGKVISEIAFKFSDNFKYLIHVSIIEPEGNSTTIDFSDIKINEAIPEQAWLIGNDF